MLLVKSALLEFLGSFAITFFGALSRLINPEKQQLSVALSYFFLVSAFSYSFVHISGAQFNPFLTLSLVLSKKIVAIKGILNMAGQITGSFVAGAVLFVLYVRPANQETLYFGYPKYLESNKLVAMIVESIMIFLLTYVYCSTLLNIKTPKYIVGVALGGVYAAAIVCFGRLSGGCVSLIQVFGPSVFSGDLMPIAFYSVAHLVGASLAAFVFSFLLQEQNNVFHHDQEDDDSVPNMIDNTLGLRENE